MLKNKFGIKTRVFLTFGFFLILTINIFLIIFYFFSEKLFMSDIKKNIDLEYSNLITKISNKENNIWELKKEISTKLASSSLFLFIGENDENIQKKYNLGYEIYNHENIVFRGDFKGYNIIIGKNISDFEKFKKNLLESSIFINFFAIVTMLIMSYFITNKVLTPLLELSKYIEKYNIEKNENLLKNRYGDSEIGIITEAVNELIKKSKNILNSQKKFVADSNHELKTPLMQIETNIELLEEKITDEKILKKFKSIKKSVENINKIVSNLGFTLRGEDKIIKKEKIDIGNYLKNFIKDYYDEANKKNIKIKLSEKDKLEILSNIYYLDRLFGNLIQNSIYYNKGNSNIKIDVFKNKVIISDKGIGIKKEDLEYIFSRFYRTDKSEEYNKNGSGLGLTIVKKICDDFGWKINIKSEKGAGSEFEIKINN